MYVGYIVGIIIAAVLIILGSVAIAVAKRNNKKCKWAVWALLFGIIALISAVINFNLFNH